jgi:hypothetical protein
MLKRPYFRLFISVFLGISGICQAIYFDPFPTCSETGRADSTFMVPLEEDLADPSVLHQGRFPTVTRFEYVPGTCIPKSVLKQRYASASAAHVTEFREREPGRIYDFTLSMMPDDGDSTRGTDFYSIRGTLDSSIQYSVPVESQSATPDTQFYVKRYIQGPGYSLIEIGYRGGADPWTRTLVDSIVVDDSGTNIYSIDGEKREIETTRCRARASTYVCEAEQKFPNRVGLSPMLETRTWFLSQGRPDSMLLVSSGGIRKHPSYASTRYYWASGTAGIKTGAVRGKSVINRSLWEGIDILGRIKAWRHMR